MPSKNTKKETNKETKAAPKKQEKPENVSAKKNTKKQPKKSFSGASEKKGEINKNEKVQPKKSTKNNKPVKTKGKNSNIREKAHKLGKYESISPAELHLYGGVKITFLGGINEIGKNLTLFEYGNDMVIIDCGMSFPDADMPGIDYVLPDLNYVERNADRIKAVFITHGHEDHIGGLPYLLKTLKVPVYASRLTIGLIEGKLKEHKILHSCDLNVIEPGDVIYAGRFSLEAIHVNHSIPDALAFALKCDAGTIIHTGDFKVDNTPIDGGVIDLARFAALGNEGVLCLLSDSTNAERPGYTPSEKNVGETLESLFVKAKGKRIIVASFASNIHRIQQIIDSSVKMGRKIFLSGRSLENVVSISRELGYINIPDDILYSIDKLKNYRDEDVVIITTGSQGEPMSALSRMAMCDHRKVTIGYNDFVIISATPIPGNEKTVANTINELMKLGADVFYDKSLGIHVSGHAAQEEQKLILNLVKPKYFIPVHGEQKHMRRHAQLAESTGIPAANIMIPELGSVIEINENRISNVSSVPAGRVFVDGSGVGDVGSNVLRDRKNLSTDGVVIVTAVTDSYTGGLMVPLDVHSKGFVYDNNANELNSYITQSCERVLDNYMRSVNMDINALRSRLKDAVSKAIFEKTKRSPVVIITVFAI